mgnify:CR=1 FL=1
MIVHRAAFWLCAFFLIGVFLQSVIGSFVIVIGAAILAALYFAAFQRYLLAALSLLMIAGSAYAGWRGIREQRALESINTIS